MPIFGKKTSILSKLHYIMGQKSQKDAFHGGKEGEGLGRIGVGLEGKLFLQFFWISTIYE